MAMGHDQKDVGNLEDNAPAEVLPGTEVMVDVGAIHFAKSERNKIVLVPQPSNDSSDPLVSSYIIRRKPRMACEYLRNDKF